jgi:predicted nucleic acid-binding Zn ribbon protein
MLTKLSSSISFQVNRLGLGKEIEAARVCAFWDKIITEKFDQTASEKSKAIRFKDKILTVAVLSSVWAQEFQYNQQDIIEKINKKFGRNIVEKIRFEL